MPTGTKVDRCYQRLKSKGKGRAARICQASTGQSLRTGKRARRSKRGSR